jgi:hypothetical protein
MTVLHALICAACSLCCMALDLCAPLQKARCLALIEEMNTGGRIPSFWTEAVGGAAASAVIHRAAAPGIQACCVPH